MNDEIIRQLERETLAGDAQALEKLKALWLRTNIRGAGLLYVRNDDEINQAVADGRRVTTRLEVGDLILVNPGDEKWPVVGPFIGTVTVINVTTASNKLADCSCIPVDYLDSPPAEGVKLAEVKIVQVLTVDGDVVTVLKRQGKEVE